MDISQKYELLDPLGKREVQDFIDFLLSKRTAIEREHLSLYKQKILSVSTWTDDEISAIGLYK